MIRMIYKLKCFDKILIFFCNLNNIYFFRFVGFFMLLFIFLDILFVWVLFSRNPF